MPKGIGTPGVPGADDLARLLKDVSSAGAGGGRAVARPRRNAEEEALRQANIAAAPQSPENPADAASDVPASSNGTEPSQGTDAPSADNANTDSPGAFADANPYATLESDASVFNDDNSLLAQAK